MQDHTLFPGPSPPCFQCLLSTEFLTFPGLAARSTLWPSFLTVPPSAARGNIAAAVASTLSREPLQGVAGYRHLPQPCWGPPTSQGQPHSPGSFLFLLAQEEKTASLVFYNWKHDLYILGCPNLS